MADRDNHLPQSASQTAGPYVHIGLAPGVAGFDIYDQDTSRGVAVADVPGERIHIEGVIYDGEGAPVLDALIEVWQADHEGRFAGDPDCAPGFHGWARVVTDFETGIWTLDTIQPGGVTGPDGTTHAPHITLWIVARGINIGLTTRIYFDDEPANEADPLLSALSDRRDTLIAKQTGDGTYRFDIRLQVDGETVFLDI